MRRKEKVPSTNPLPLNEPKERAERVMGTIYSKAELRLHVKEATEGVQLSGRGLCGLCFTER